MCRKIYYKYQGFDRILDETNSEINGNDNFYSSNVEFTANDVKLKRKDKFKG